MDGEQIRKLLSDLPTAPFIWSAEGKVVIMEEKSSRPAAIRSPWPRGSRSMAATSTARFRWSPPAAG